MRRISIFVYMLLSAMVTLVALTPSPADALPLPQNCEQKLFVVVVRGSGEAPQTNNPDDGQLGMGTPGYAMYGNLAARLVRAGVSSAGLGLDYPAVDVPAAAMTQGFLYTLSAEAGYKALRAQLRAHAQFCPNQYFGAIGYSQGADVVATTLTDMLSHPLDAVDRNVLARVVTVSLFGDPRFNPKDKWADSFNSKIKSGGVFGARVKFPPAFPHTQSSCLSKDPVCNAFPPYIPACVPGPLDHLCQHYQYVTSGATNSAAKDAEEEILRRLGKRPVPPVPPPAPLLILTSSLPAALQGVAYSAVLSAAGGAAPLTWSLASGSLPVGLSLSGGGRISGTPSGSGLARFSVAVRDSFGSRATVALTLPVAARDGSGGPGVARRETLSAGSNYTCAVVSGAAKCWGYNRFAQLGNGTYTDSSAPTGVVGLGSGVSSVSAGPHQACAVTTGGAVRCWGNDALMEFGTDIPAPPVAVVGLGSGVAAVTSSQTHACALTTAGAVKCWGNNDLGQLGNGTFTASATPVGVTGLGSGVAAISAIGPHTCALTTAGGVKCWGMNGVGELGNGTTSPPDGATSTSNIPVNVLGLGSGVSAITSGFSSSCALTTPGAVKCWGSNASGQLGNGTLSNSSVPVTVVGLGSGVSQVSSDAAHACAVTTAGAVKCWGNNVSGALGDGSTVGSTTPVNVTGLGSGVAMVAVGQSHTCAVTTAGGVRCWGSNFGGALGDGTTTDSSTPVDVLGLP